MGTSLLGWLVSVLLAAATGLGTTTVAAQPEPFDRTAHSTTDPTSPWVVVNKTHPVAPSDFRPDVALVRGYQVARPAAAPLARLLAAGDRRGLG